MKDTEITERIRGFPFQMGLKRIQKASGSEISALLELRCCWMRSTGSWWNSICPSSPSISTPRLSRSPDNRRSICKSLGGVILSRNNLRSSNYFICINLLPLHNEVQANRLCVIIIRLRWLFYKTCLHRPSLTSLNIGHIFQVLTEMCVTLIRARVSIENLRLGWRFTRYSSP